MGILKNILKENNCSKKYGKVLFKLFSDMGYYPKDYYPDELDTKDEQKLFGLMKSFIHGDFDYNEKSPELEKHIVGLMKCKGTFNGALVPNNQAIFRGTSITIDEFEKFESDTYKQMPSYRIYKNFTYNPKSKLQSWTTDWKVAEQFIYKQFSKMGDKIPVILKINKPDKSFIFNDKFTNMFMFDEDEVIRYGGKIKCDEIQVWVNA